MSFKTELIALRKTIAKTLLKLSEVQASDGTVFVFEGDLLTIGMAVNTYDETGAQVPVADGDYEIQDLGVVVVKDGIIEDIKESEVEPVEPDVPVETPMSQTPVELDAILAQLISLEDRITALESNLSSTEAALSEQTEKVVKMSQHFAPEIKDEKSLTDLKLSNTEIAATKAMRYFEK